MTIAEIIKIESERNGAFNVVHLIREGNFYHANDWSAWLISLVPQIEKFLKEELGLEIHRGKLHISEVHSGVEFLGAYVKPFRTYVSRRTLERMKKKIAAMDFTKPKKVIRSVNSYLGIFQHTDSYKIRRNMFMQREFLKFGIFNKNMTKITDRNKYYKSSKNKQL